MQLTRQETQTKILFLAKWLWLTLRSFQVLNLIKTYYFDWPDAISGSVSLYREISADTSSTAARILVLSALCLSRNKLPFGVSWLKKIKGLLREGGTAHQRSQVLSFSNTFPWKREEAVCRPLSRTCARLSPLGFTAPNTTDIAGCIFLHKAYAQHREKQPLQELVLCTVRRFLAANLLCHSGWKGMFWADKFSLAATFIYLYLLFVKVWVPFSVAWGLFSLFCFFPLLSLQFGFTWNRNICGCCLSFSPENQTCLFSLSGLDWEIAVQARAQRQSPYSPLGEVLTPRTPDLTDFNGTTFFLGGLVPLLILALHQ